MSKKALLLHDFERGHLGDMPRRGVNTILTLHQMLNSSKSTARILMKIGMVMLLWSG